VIVCLCEGLRERDLEAHVARGATTVAELGRVCRAGRSCGMCAPDLVRIVARGRDATERPVADALAAK
jgi:assimilatory nitrate reductase catalytic subunit